MRQWTIVVIIAFCLAASSSYTEARDNSGVLKASQLMGMKVEGTDGKKVGKIRDLVIDPEDGAIEYAVLDFGGIAGIGDKYFAVPWDALEWTADKKKLTLDVTKKDLKQAPGFDKNNWPDLSDQKQSVVIYEFYGVPVPSEGIPSEKGK